MWSEPCEPCDGKGQELLPQRLTVAVPAGVADGDRFSFTLWLPRGPRTRVDVRVAVTRPSRVNLTVGLPFLIRPSGWSAACSETPRRFPFDALCNLGRKEIDVALHCCGLPTLA